MPRLCGYKGEQPKAFVAMGESFAYLEKNGLQENLRGGKRGNV